MSVAISTPASNDFNTSIGLPRCTEAQSRPLRHGSAPSWKEWAGGKKSAPKPSETDGFPHGASNASVARRGLFQPLDDVPDDHRLAVCIAGDGLRRLAVAAIQELARGVDLCLIALTLFADSPKLLDHPRPVFAGDRLEVRRASVRRSRDASIQLRLL